MSESIRSGDQTGTIRQAVARRLGGAVALAVLIAVAGAGYLNAVQEDVHTAHSVHLVSASSSGVLPAPAGECCSEEGPSSISNI